MQVSIQYGNNSVWPGDTFGISTLPSGPAPGLGSPQQVLLSWGSAVGQPDSEIYAAAVSYPGGLG